MLTFGFRVFGILLCSRLLSAGVINSGCRVQETSRFNPVSYEALPCPSSVSVLDPVYHDGVHITVDGTDTMGSVRLTGSIDFTHSDVLSFQAWADYTGSNRYIVPGSGTGTIQAVVFAAMDGCSSLSGFFCGGITNGTSRFTLGSTVYSCSGCLSGSPALGTYAGTYLGGIIPATRYNEIGTYALGQPFSVSFEMSQYLSDDKGETATQVITGGILGLQFFDANGNQVTPINLTTPEPLMALPVGCICLPA